VRVADAHRGLPVGALVLRAVTVAWLALALPMALFALNMLRVPVCEPLAGLAFVALGPGVGVTLAATLGVGIGAFVPRVRLATTLAVLAPVAGAAWEIWAFYATPAVFAYGHFHGYFPGTLYDPDITIGWAYVSFRALTLLWWAALVTGLASVWDPQTRRASVAVSKARWPLLVLCFALCVGGVALEGEGHRLGHWSTSDTIAEALGGRTEGERCVVIHPRETPRSEARRLAADCDFRVVTAERGLGLRQPAPVTAFFFRSTDEKRILMGASSTYVAKPWRNEVYLQVGDWPHPVLFHEVVHVVAGNAGRGPFRVSGFVSGWLPSPAIIEGVAVAVAWDAREGLTPHQWAAAMLELELNPSVRSVESLGFLLEPAGRAYTTSGSFVRFLMDTRGRDVVRRLYLAGNFEDALGEPLEEVEAEWHAFLRGEVELPPEALALAQARFERPGIFGSICPHVIANLRQDLGADLAAGDDPAAVERCEAILALDEGQAGTRALYVGALARLERDTAAQEQLDVLVGPPAAAGPLVQHARQERADALWRRGESATAERIFEDLLDEPMSEDSARQIEVRLLAIEAGGEAEIAIRDLLVPPRDETNDAATAMVQVARLRAARDDGLADYLAARQMMFRRRFGLALPLIAQAREAGLPSDRTRDEARRMDAIIRFGAGDLDGSAQRWREILRDEASAPGERVEARDWLARIRWAR